VSTVIQSTPFHNFNTARLKPGPTEGEEEIDELGDEEGELEGE